MAQKSVPLAPPRRPRPGRGEHLPFRDACFDVVFHVGGINFFNDKALAIREMIRVAKPGIKLLIVDETERVVERVYQRLPIVRRYFQARSSEVAIPIDLVPPDVQELRIQEFFDGRLYCITFRKRAQIPV
jgi:SAM-dependent methyltransferase